MSVAAKIVSNNIWKVVCPKPGHTQLGIDQSLSRDELQQQNGYVITIKDDTFSVDPGETIIVMRLSNSGKPTQVR